MIFKEIILSIKKYKLLNSVLYLQISLFFLLFGTFIVFINELEYESNKLQNAYEDKAIYHLIDNYYDGNKYDDFISQPDYLYKLKDFYTKLNTSGDFQYLAMFNHHIFLEDSNNKIPLKFIEGYENGNQKHQEKNDGILLTAVKSFQLNKEAFDFFKLSVSEGTVWDASEFKRSSKVLPVILGSSYKNIFAIGEETTIRYYNKLVSAKIIGFLEENSKVYYNNPEFYLDDYIILPYIEYGQPISANDELFQQINFFAMINGFIVTENDPSNTQMVFQRVEAIAKKSGISYSFIGLNPHFLKYKGLMTILQENSLLVQTIFLLITLLNLAVINIIIFLQQKRRQSILAIHYLYGASKFRLIGLQMLEVGILFFAAYLSSFVILIHFMKLGDILTQLLLLLLCIAMCVFACIFPVYRLLVSPLVLNNNEGE